MPIRFDDRVVLITGAGAGLGRAHALGFAALGARLALVDLAGADAVAAEIGEAAVAEAASVTDGPAMQAVVERALARFGRIDVVVANAGILRDRSFAKMEPAEWDAVMAVHLDGAFHTIRAAWPAMREQGYGRVVTTTSSSGLFGNFGQANYAAAKMGLVGLTRTLAIEGQKNGIRVNAIAPIAWTRMTEALFPPGTDDLFAPEKVTPGVLFLASEAAPSGVVLSAGGGAFAEARIVEGAPVMVAERPSADELASRWAEIAAAPAQALPNGPLQTLAFLQAVQRA